MSGGFEAGVTLRPRSLDEVVDLAFAYARRHPRLMLRWMAGHGLLAAGTVAVVHYVLDWNWLSVWCLAAAVGVVLEAVQLSALGAHLFGRPPSLRTAYRSLVRASGIIAILAALTTLPLQIMGGSGGDETLLGLSVLSAMFWPLLLAAQYHLVAVIVLERVPLRRATRRAWLLGSFGFGHALSLVLVSLALRAAAVYVVETFVQVTTTVILQFDAPFESLWNDGGSTASVAAYLAFGPFMALVYLLAYVDARTRTEGWDLQVRFNELARRRRDHGRRAA